MIKKKWLLILAFILFYLGLIGVSILFIMKSGYRNIEKSKEIKILTFEEQTTLIDEINQKYIKLENDVNAKYQKDIDSINEKFKQEEQTIKIKYDDLENKIKEKYNVQEKDVQSKISDYEYEKNPIVNL